MALQIGGQRPVGARHGTVAQHTCCTLGRIKTDKERHRDAHLWTPLKGGKGDKATDTVVDSSPYSLLPDIRIPSASR